MAVAKRHAPAGRSDDPSTAARDVQHTLRESSTSQPSPSRHSIQPSRPPVAQDNDAAVASQKREHSNQRPAKKTKPAAASPAKQQTGRFNVVRRTFNRFWIWEILCWLLALGCIAAIVGLLYSSDGQPLPSWRYGITLNAIVSLLATVVVFSLVVPVSSSLGQLKWLRMRRARPLVDFELIEDAGRGPSGSLVLLLHGRGGYEFRLFGVIIPPM